MMTLLKIPRFNSHRCLRLLHCHLSIYLFIYTWSSSFSPTTTIITFCSITTLWLMMGRSVGTEWVKYAPPPLAAQIIFPEESHFNLSNMISAGLTSLFIVTITDDPYLATSLFSYLLLRITKLLLLLLKLLFIPTLEATEEDAARSGERVTACLTMSEGTHWLLRATISQLVGWLVGL